MEEGRKKGKGNGNCEAIARRRCGRLLGDRREKVAAKKVKAIFPLTDELVGAARRRESRGRICFTAASRSNQRPTGV